MKQQRLLPGGRGQLEGGGLTEGGIVVVLGQGGYVTNMMMVLVLVAIQLMGNNQTEINVIPFLWLKWMAVLVLVIGAVPQLLFASLVRPDLVTGIL